MQKVNSINKKTNSERLLVERYNFTNLIIFNIYTHRVMFFQFIHYYIKNYGVSKGRICPFGVNSGTSVSREPS